MTVLEAFETLRDGAMRHDETLAPAIREALTLLAAETGLDAGTLARLGESWAAAPAVDRSGCRERVCYCHDDGSWRPGLYPEGCSSCGCRWAAPLPSVPKLRIEA